jgi:two-component system response regulator AtoC
MKPALVLAVEPEDLQTRLRREFADAGWVVLESPARADLSAAVSACDVALVGIQAVGGVANLRALIERAPETAIVVVSGRISEADAVEALRLGAFDYVGSPADSTHLLLTARKALQATRLRREVAVCRAEHALQYGFDAIVGASPEMAHVRSLVASAAESDRTPVLLLGEHGTGKHLIARVLHFSSARSGRPFLRVTCAGLAEESLSSALFGHERGAFPGARDRAPGLLERAHGGTLLIDEIGVLPPRLQAKLLRLLDDGSLVRAGGVDVIRTDVRVVAAHRGPLDAMVSDGTFDRELGARLHRAVVRLPSLRERPGDILLLANHYVGRFNDELRRSVRGFADDASRRLERHTWPGNVRELRNAIERAMVIVEGDLIRPVDLAAISALGSSSFRLPAEGVAIEEVERQLLVQALERVQGNQTRAGQLLGLNRDQIRYRIDKFGIGLAGSSS